MKIIASIERKLPSGHTTIFRLFQAGLTYYEVRVLYRIPGYFEPSVIEVKKSDYPKISAEYKVTL